MMQLSLANEKIRGPPGLTFELPMRLENKKGM